MRPKQSRVEKSDCMEDDRRVYIVEPIMFSTCDLLHKGLDQDLGNNHKTTHGCAEY
jgi:hypothetical protein